MKKNTSFPDSNGDKSYDTIFMEEVVRTIDIGIYDFEIGNPQRLSFDFYVKLKISKNLTNDDINQVLNYEYLVKTLDSVISNNRFFLLETLAERLMKDILIPENVTAASIFISKLDILESGKIGYSMTRIK